MNKQLLTQIFLEHANKQAFKKINMKKIKTTKYEMYIVQMS